MIEQTDPPTSSPDTPPRLRRPAFIFFIATLALLLLAYLFATRQLLAARLLKPLNRSTATPAGIFFDKQPALVTFTQLNADPVLMLNRHVRVTGNFTPVDKPKCPDLYSGPLIRWALIAEELQLDVLGLERVVKLIPPGMTLTIDGIWRLYQGPLGCGKEAPQGSSWYLAITRIVQPNPLPNFLGVITPGAAQGEPQPDETPTQEGESTPQAISTATQTAVTPIPTATPTIVGATLTATPTLDPFITVTATATATLFNTPLPTNTLAPGVTPTATQTPTMTPTSTATSTTGGTPVATLPTLPTATPDPDGYPGGSPTATATPEGGYP